MASQIVKISNMVLTLLAMIVTAVTAQKQILDVVILVKCMDVLILMHVTTTLKPLWMTAVVLNLMNVVNVVVTDLQSCVMTVPMYVMPQNVHNLNRMYILLQVMLQLMGIWHMYPCLMNLQLMLLEFNSQLVMNQMLLLL
jgi:hypothetical protein